MEKMRWMVLGMLAAGMLLAATPLAAQQRFHATLSSGLGNGESLLYSWHLAASGTYTPLPYLGVQIHIENYEKMTAPRSGGSITMTDKQLQNEISLDDLQSAKRVNVGSLRFYGVGVSFRPIAIARPLTRHILCVDCGIGVERHYSVNIHPRNPTFGDAGYSVDWGFYATLRYGYQFWEHVG